MSGSDDPQERRAALRDEWEAAAERWERRRAWLEDAAGVVGERMVDRIAPRPGQRVLEAACGLGDTGLRAAERVGSSGEVILADAAEAMVQAARRNADARALTNVTARRMELEWLDAPTADLDAVLVRFGYMLVVDAEAGLRDARRVLRPGGTIALATWARREENPWMDVVRRPFEARGLVPSSAPGAPHMFSMADPAALTEVLLDAGFLDVGVEPVDLLFTAVDAAAHRDAVLDTSATMAAVVGRLEEADRAAVLAEVDAAVAAAAEGEDDVRLRGRALVAWGAA